MQTNKRPSQLTEGESTQTITNEKAGISLHAVREYGQLDLIFCRPDAEPENQIPLRLSHSPTEADCIYTEFKMQAEAMRA